jgi:hypothetical protein
MRKIAQGVAARIVASEREGPRIMRFAGSRTASRLRRRGYKPCLQGLEPRDLPATTVSSIITAPTVLNPPNNRFVKVTVAGNVIESTPKGNPHAQYQVSDEYHQFEPGGKVTLKKVLPTVYTFEFSVVLQAHRAQTDNNGRLYFITVGAQDTETAGGLTAPILVPHGKLVPGTYPVVSTVTLHAPKVHRDPPAKGSGFPKL